MVDPAHRIAQARRAIDALEQVLVETNHVARCQAVVDRLDTMWRAADLARERSLQNHDREGVRVAGAESRAYSVAYDLVRGLLDGEDDGA